MRAALVACTACRVPHCFDSGGISGLPISGSWQLSMWERSVLVISSRALAAGMGGRGRLSLHYSFFDAGYIRYALPIG